MTAPPGVRAPVSWLYCMAIDPVNEAFDLGDWHVDVGGNRLLRNGEARPLRHKAMALLVLLARHAGQTASDAPGRCRLWRVATGARSRLAPRCSRPASTGRTTAAASSSAPSPKAQPG